LKTLPLKMNGSLWTPKKRHLTLPFTLYPYRPLFP
jgi:hypothetical protein